MTTDSDSLKVPGNLESIAEIRQWLEDFLRRVTVSPETVDDILSAVTEICSNVVRHGYTSDNAGDIELTAAFGPETIEITVIDSAPAFVPESEASLPAHRLAEGGYGTFLVDSLMDQVTYEPLGDTGNRTTLVKRIAADPEGPNNSPLLADDRPPLS